VIDGTSDINTDGTVAENPDARNAATQRRCGHRHEPASWPYCPRPRRKSALRPRRVHLAQRQRRLLHRLGQRALRHLRARLVSAAPAGRLPVLLGAGISLLPGEKAAFCAPATPPSAAASHWFMAGRFRPGCLYATARSRHQVPRHQDRAWLCDPTRGVSAVLIPWCHRAKGICAALLGSTNVVLRDGRRSRPWHADVAQLVAHHLAKVRVAGSNPVIRSKVHWHQPQRWSGRVVRQRPAKPCTRVRFPSPPPRMTRRD
jgi:hypothetical protein